MNTKIYTLALDTANNGVSVAFLENQTVIAHQTQIMERGQGEALIPMIDDLSKSISLSLSDLGRVAVSVGPGSFTGVRIGLSTARGIGLALDIPVYGVSSLQITAYQIPGKVLAVLDTKRGDFYTQIFQDSHPIESPQIRTLQQIRNLMPLPLTGDGISVLPADLGSFYTKQVLDPASSVGLCSFSDSLPPEPLYLRDANVTL